MREPTLAWWPGKIAAGSVCDAVAGNIDFLPTFVSLAGGTVPADRKIDGKDISPLLLGRTKESPHEARYYFDGYKLQAVRPARGSWPSPRSRRHGQGWAGRCSLRSKSRGSTTWTPTSARRTDVAAAASGRGRSPRSRWRSRWRPNWATASPDPRSARPVTWRTP